MELLHHRMGGIGVKKEVVDLLTGPGYRPGLRSFDGLILSLGLVPLDLDVGDAPHRKGAQVLLFQGPTGRHEEATPTIGDVLRQDHPYFGSFNWDQCHNASAFHP